MPVVLGPDAKGKLTLNGIFQVFKYKLSHACSPWTRWWAVLIAPSGNPAIPQGFSLWLSVSLFISLNKEWNKIYKLNESLTLSLVFII